MRSYIFQCITSVHNLQQKCSILQEVEFVTKNKKTCVCVWTTGTSQKFAIFDQKIHQEVKKSVSFIRYPSCCETTIHITFLKFISFAVCYVPKLHSPKFVPLLQTAADRNSVPIFQKMTQCHWFPNQKFIFQNLSFFRGKHPAMYMFS